jgi:hypothetical protein
MSKIVVVILIYYRHKSGTRGNVVVRPEDRGFDTRLGDFLILPNSSGRARP